MNSSFAAHLETESYNTLMPRKTGPIKATEESLTTITIEEDGIRNKISIHGATWATSANFSKKPLVYTPGLPVDKRDDHLDESRGQTAT